MLMPTGLALPRRRRGRLHRQALRDAVAQQHSLPCGGQRAARGLALPREYDGDVGEVSGADVEQARADQCQGVRTVAADQVVVAVQPPAAAMKMSPRPSAPVMVLGPAVSV